MRCTVSDVSTHAFISFENVSVPSTSLKKPFHWRSESVRNCPHKSSGFPIVVSSGIFCSCPPDCMESLSPRRAPSLRLVLILYGSHRVHIVSRVHPLDRLLQHRLVAPQHVNPAREEHVAGLRQRIHA